MTREQHLLIILAEECAEVAHRASKAIRFGFDEIQSGQALSNRQRLEYELADLRTVAEMLDLTVGVSPEKAEKVEHFMGYSHKLGKM